MILELFGKYFHCLVSAEKWDLHKVLFGIQVDESVITKEHVISDKLIELFNDVASKLEQPLKPSFEKLNKFINSKVTNDVSFYIPQL